MAGMDDYLNGTSYTGDSSEGGGQPMSIDDNGNSFYGRITNNQDLKYGDHDASKEARQKNAASGLANGEKSALGSNGSKITGDGTTGARQGENNVMSDNVIGSKSSGGFMNKVMGKEAAKGRGIKGGGWQGRMKRIAPIIAASCGIGGFGVASFFTQMAMPFSIVAQLKENFNSIAVSQHVRTRHLYTYQTDVNKRLVKDCKKARIFGPDKFSISPRQKDKFDRIGIKVDKSTNPTTLKWKADNGEMFTIYPDEGYDMSGAEGHGVTLDSFYEENQEFRDKYAAGARTWRGGVKAWFDGICNKFLAHFGVSRGVWSRFKKGQLLESDLKKVRSTVSDGAHEGTMLVGSSGTAEHDGHVGEILDDEGEHQGWGDRITETPTGATVDDNAIYSDDIETNNKTGLITDPSPNSSKMHTKLSNFANKVAGAAKVTGKISAIASTVCGIMTALNAINLVVQAYQTTQILKTVTALFEGVQKAQVEDSTTTPVHAIGQSLLMESTKTYNYRQNPNSEIVSQDRTSNAMRSASMQAMYGNHAIDYHDLSIQSFSLSNAAGWIGSALSTISGWTGDTFYTCTLAQLAAHMAGAVGDIVDILLCIFSVGIGCLVDMLIDAGIAFVADVIRNTAISYIVSIAMPFVVNIITRKLATEFFGEDFGNAIVSGGNSYMAGNGLISGGSVANQDSLTTYLAYKNEVDEDNARIARETLSPFDYTSKYTFAGSMVAKMIPVMTNTSTVIGSLTSIGNVFTKSISSIMPGASAAAAGITIQEAANQTKEHCNELDSIGAVGDAFCNPYIITDTSTLSDDPGDIVNQIAELKPDSFESGEDKDVPVIKENSNLAKYLVYCGQRQSPFGMIDNNIQTAITNKYSTGAQIVDSLVNQIPVVGDLIGVLQDIELLNNYGWITGKTCVTNNQQEGLDLAPSWDEVKLYQRFSEDQRLIENMGLVEKSSVTAFLDKYYTEHPDDNSYEGILARRSGLTKDQVSATIGYMEYLQWQDQYNPIGYAPYIQEEKEEDQLHIEEDYDYYGSIIAVAPNLFYEERRIRNFAA